MSRRRLAQAVRVLHVQELGTGFESAVHIAGASMASSTLCGSDCFVEDTDEPVDCTECIGVLKYCQSIRLE